ncbi:hypothetical protein AB0O64_37915, partial [Streptomyces sp. NPDC088341]|uniref:hypothetical protein n=1 Tax=Streptomyces sp. NPDC088341 TaxID=3154870 RepID=UPI00342C1B49
MPTGQALEAAGTLDDARALTAGGLLGQLRAQAYALAYAPEAGDRRRDGQQWLAVHMRTAGMVTGRDAAHRCGCGGLLIVATRAGALAHVDACAECYT